MVEARQIPMPEEETEATHLRYIGPDAEDLEPGDEDDEDADAVEAEDDEADTIAAATGTIGAEPHKSGYDHAQASWDQESGKKAE